MGRQYCLAGAWGVVEVGRRWVMTLGGEEAGVEEGSWHLVVGVVGEGEARR